MPLDNNLDGNNEIAHFLEKFKETEQSYPSVEPDLFTVPEKSQPVRPGQYARSFEKLEQKIHELEEKFEASTTQNHLILSELSRTREVMERQKDKEAFLEHLSRTIATLRTSVENLTRAQEANSFSYREPSIQRSFDPIPPSHTATELYAAEQEAARLRQERDEQDRLFSSLRQKASQLKAVNSALDREIKKTQQEKLDALKKSADQAKEILSLRDQLTAAEERFKSFDFEGRIISIKREYQQKVSSLETQLKEMSDTCMRQVEEIEALKAKNSTLQAVAAEKEALQIQLAEKDKQLAEVKQAMAALQARYSEEKLLQEQYSQDRDKQLAEIKQAMTTLQARHSQEKLSQEQRSQDHDKQLAAYTTRLRELEEQRTQLSLALEKSQLTLGALRREKDTLEKNFKELVLRINQNDAVISQLKEKIDVLARQNTELAHRNNALVQRNQELTQTATVLMRRNETLSQSNSNLTHNNETLARTNLDLTQEKENLAKQNAALTHDKEELTKTNLNLTRDKEELTKTNLHLSRNQEAIARKVTAPVPPEKTTKAQAPQPPAAPVPQVKKEKEVPAKPAVAVPVNQAKTPADSSTVRTPEAAPVQGHSAALLAARLVQEHAQKKAVAKAEKTESSHQETKSDEKGTNRSAAPETTQGQTSVLHSLGRTFQTVPAPEEEEWEVVSAKAQPTIESEEDLPEIKVADPVPQDNLFDGEDFLEKTGSFIGRMKWSIFRESR